MLHPVHRGWTRCQKSMKSMDGFTTKELHFLRATQEQSHLGLKRRPTQIQIFKLTMGKHDFLGNNMNKIVFFHGMLDRYLHSKYGKIPFFEIKNGYPIPPNRKNTPYIIGPSHMCFHPLPSPTVSWCCLSSTRQSFNCLNFPNVRFFFHT